MFSTMEENARDPDKLRDHMANERTFLAWIRTALGLIAFGFVLERFSLFIRHFALIEGTPLSNSLFQENYPISIGVFLVAAGGLISFLAYLDYLRLKKGIDMGNGYPSTSLQCLLTLFMVLTTILLLIFMKNS